MPRPEDQSLPQNWSSVEKSQAVVIYASPQQQQETAARSAFGLLFVLAVITLCGVIAGICAWRTWGQEGVISQIAAQQAITEETRAIGDYRNQLSRQNIEMDRMLKSGKISAPPLPPQHNLITAQTRSVDAARREFDANCAAITTRTPGDDKCQKANEAPRCVWVPSDTPPRRRCALPEHVAARN
ncbi:MAG TPA: hypothetical protein VG841_04330 [Caulobacterales bacterium]|nr:hypothetical protein [Caulobacterales bacterium]